MNSYRINTMLSENENNLSYTPSLSYCNSAEGYYRSLLKRKGYYMDEKTSKYFLSLIIMALVEKGLLTDQDASTIYAAHSLSTLLTLLSDRWLSKEESEYISTLTNYITEGDYQAIDNLTPPRTLSAFHKNILKHLSKIRAMVTNMGSAFN